MTLKSLLTILFIGIIICNAQTRTDETRRVETSEQKNNVELALESLQNDVSLKNAAISCKVLELNSKKTIAELNPYMSVTPASTMKVVTTATALETLGSYKRFKTKLAYSGYIDTNCILHGDIYIIGGGDPTLGSSYLSSSSSLFDDWAIEIQKLGVHSIDGNIIGDSRIFGDEYIPSTWQWGDIGNYYGAGASGLTIFDNLLNLYFDTGSEVKDSTQIVCYEPYSPDIEIENRVVSADINNDQAYIYGAPYNGYRIVKGNLPLKESEFKVRGSIHEPAYIAAYYLEHKLHQYGITTHKKATTVRRLLQTNALIEDELTEFYSQSSPSVSKIVYWTNLVSNNLFAEHLLRHVGIATHSNGSVFSSTAGVSSFWKKQGVNTNGLSVSDGSGLSRANAISAYHLTEILSYMRTKSKYADSFYTSLPIAGKTGTLKSYGKKSKIYNNLRAKSGTMTRVKSFTGYVTAANGKKLVFAIIVNNYNCSTYQIGRKLDAFMKSLGNYND